MVRSTDGAKVDLCPPLLHLEECGSKLLCIVREKRHQTTVGANGRVRRDRVALGTIATAPQVCASFDHLNW